MDGFGYYGPLKSWIIIYNLPVEECVGAADTGTTIVSADCMSEAISIFQRLYRGKFSTIREVKELG